MATWWDNKQKDRESQRRIEVRFSISKKTEDKKRRFTNKQDRYKRCLSNRRKYELQEKDRMYIHLCNYLRGVEYGKGGE